MLMQECKHSKQFKKEFLEDFGMWFHLIWHQATTIADILFAFVIFQCHMYIGIGICTVLIITTVLHAVTTYSLYFSK
jgi:hypothetical protein